MLAVMEHARSTHRIHAPICGVPQSSKRSAPLVLSVIIPTLNERGNVLPLFTKLDDALSGLEWEAVFVDDGSTDGTVEIITALAAGDRRARLIHRFGRRGLASAVVEGMLSSTAPVVAVIDADLQHDEALLPHLFKAVVSGQCDMAVGSRYSIGGSVGEWSNFRTRISRFATKLAEVITKAPMSDPMSGFFAVKRDRLVEAAPYLSGRGYKVLLDIVTSSPKPLSISEFPYCFRPRKTGESKLDTMVVLEYLQLLLDKTVGCYVPMRVVVFVATGALGLCLHLLVLAFCLFAFALTFSYAIAVATVSTIILNFTLSNLLTYRDRRLHGWRFLHGMSKFSVACSLGAVANVGVSNLLYDHQSWWVAGMAGAAIGAVWNYAVGGAVMLRRGS